MPDETEKIPVKNRDDAKGKFWGSLYRFFDDLLTLDVITMTGEVKLESADISDFDSVFTKLKNSASDLQVVAQSHHEIDYDAMLFIKKELSEDQKEMLKLHQETVKSAQEMRAKVVEVAANAIKTLV